MNIIETKLQGVYLIESEVHVDTRGFFMESYNKQSFNEHGFNEMFVQDNHSLTIDAGTIRGLHYQLNPKAQSKLIRVIAGGIFDVVVDIRESSNTFACWIGIELSEANKRQLLIPPGFAHGFCTTMPNTQVLYKTDQFYSPDCERGILWNDPTLNIDWPTKHPILSDKDQSHPYLKDADINFE